MEKEGEHLGQQAPLRELYRKTPASLEPGIEEPQKEPPGLGGQELSPAPCAAPAALCPTLPTLETTKAARLLLALLTDNTWAQPSFPVKGAYAPRASPG